MDRFPGTEEVAAALPVSSAIIDGEAVCVNERGLPDWATLHRALARWSCPEAVLFVFDLLFLDEQDCPRRLLLERKRALAERRAKVPLDSAIAMSRPSRATARSSFAKPVP
jgi:ATP-dependent DNA ligase